LKGKGAQITCIVALYCPCFSDGSLSTYQQHCQGLTKQNRNENPHQAVLTDLEKELTLWQEEGDHVILLMDFNEDVCLPWIKQFFAKVNLLDVLTKLMGPIGTATHNMGSTLIDGIYVSRKLFLVVKGGYLVFDTGIPNNHRALWIDLPGVILGLCKAYTPKQSNAQHLQCKDPCVVRTYLQMLSQQLSTDNLLSRAANLIKCIKLGQLTRD